MSDLIDIAGQIHRAVGELDKMRGHIKARSDRRAKAIANYDRVLGITIVKLKNGIEFDLGGQKIKDPPTTILDKIARGICWKEKLELEEADADYKSLITNINTLDAQKLGLQSINKNLE